MFASPEPAAPYPEAQMPYGIKTRRLVLRCYRPEDAAELQSVLARSREHLLPWLPWAALEPQTQEDKLELVRRFRGKFDLNLDFALGIFAADDRSLLGGTGLHPRIGPEAREIGYWVAPEHEGKGLISEAVRGLVWVGFELLRLHKLEIRLDPLNERSRRIPMKLGFHLDGRLRANVAHGKGELPLRDSEVWSLLRSEFERRNSDFQSVEAFDALGRPI